jgi:hypothetical protein
MDLPVAPPAQRDVLFLARRLQPLRGPERPRHFRIHAQHVVLQHVEDLRHGNKDRHLPPFDLFDDLHRVVAAHEDHRTRQHRRDERRHRLAEHMAQRQ